MRNYTDEEVLWLKENVPNSNWKTITEEFNKTFGKSKTLWALKTTCNRNGIYAKGLSQYGKCWNALPVGAETPLSNGYVRIRTEKSKVYVMKQRLIYQEHYGEIPKGYEVVFLDKDKSNYDIENLFLVSRKAIAASMIMTRWNKWFTTTDPVLNKTMWMWLELVQETKKRIKSE